LKAGAYAYADLVAMATHPSKEVAEWARKAAVEPTLLKKSVLVTMLLAKLAEYKDEKDPAKEPIPAIEVLLAGQGLVAAGDTMKDRIDSLRAGWDKARLPALDKDIARSIDE